MYNTETFIKKAQSIHKNADGTPKYDYSKVKYVNSHTKVCIICHNKDEFGVEHGEFWQTPKCHLKGENCPKCTNNVSSGDFFIEKAKEKHKNEKNESLYDYSKVNYKNSLTKVCIICPLHGEFWQSPGRHLMGDGCPKCKASKMEDAVMKLFSKYKIEYISQAGDETLAFIGKLKIDFYLPEHKIAIECQGEQHFKSIKHFGGKDYYDKQKMRDLRKYNLCVNNGISMFYLIPSKISKAKIYNQIYNENNVFYYEEIIPLIAKVNN